MKCKSDGLNYNQTQDRTATNLHTNKVLPALAALTVALLGILIFTATNNPAHTDFIEYWSSARLLLRHADPYSPEGVFTLEKAHGFLKNTPLVMLNPPWTLFLIVPIGFDSIFTAHFLWILGATGCILASAQLFGRPSRYRAYALAFAPALACLCSGQSSPFLLLGFSLFLHFHHRRPFLAGASLLFMAIKPHLFLVFWFVLLFDCICRRRFRILVGGISALAAATTFSICLDTHVWQQYIGMLHRTTLEQRFIPTGSMLFRLLIDPKAAWLLFVPSVLAIFWGLWYYATRRNVWDWRTHGMLLMLVTIATSPYGFITDEIVLLPSIAFALALPEKRKYSTAILIAINGLALGIMSTGAQLASAAYVWTPLAWLAWFLYATLWQDNDRQIPWLEPLDAEKAGRLTMSHPAVRV